MTGWGSTVSSDPRIAAARLFGVGMAALFWELALIRWFGACMRIVAYYSNFVLIAAFFGLGLGALLARRDVRLGRAAAPIVAGTVLAALAFSGARLTNLGKTGEYVWLGSTAGVADDGGAIVAGPLALLVAYACTAATFTAFGQWMGQLFRAFPPLTAYSIEIGGSIAGILLFGTLSALGTPPVVWFAVGFALLLAVLGRDAVALGVAAVSAVVAIGASWGYSSSYHWSPYYKIHDEEVVDVVSPSGELVHLDAPIGRAISVNNDYHQMMLDLRPRPEPELPLLAVWRRIYDRPYRGADHLPPGPVLVVGAGSGNDVSAALRNTDRDVVAVDIDPAILDLGRRYHAEQPYASPRVTVVNDDARSFFQHTDQRFALVVFGFLDSHTLLSSFSSLRLDNYVYTRESLEQVHELLVPGGRVSLTFMANTRWLDQRMSSLVEGVFGHVESEQEPYTTARMYFAEKTDDPPRPNAVRVPTDDWPFLYLERATIPTHYLSFMTIALLLGCVALFVLPRGQRSIRVPYLLLGAAFFLLETSNVTSLSLLFGSTWVVNLVVFSGILVLVLFGNLTAARGPKLPRAAWFGLLGLSVLVAWATPVGALLPYPEVVRAVAAVPLFLGPAYFAAIVFASLIAEEPDLAPAYGSNVLGTVAGGVAEYLSLVGGFKVLLLVTFTLYAATFVILRVQRRA